MSQAHLRLPITPAILQLLFSSWSQSPSFDSTMLWAACCVGFFGFLRSGEFTCQSSFLHHPTVLSPQDVSVDCLLNPTTIALHLRHSKSDPFGAGVTVYLGRTGQRPLCPVTALLSYMALRGQAPGPLFRFQDGSALSKQRLLVAIRSALAVHGFDGRHIKGHSFRIGAATAAAHAGLDDSAIQTLGRWRSAAFLRYVRLSPQSLSSMSSRLVSPLSPAVRVSTTSIG